MVLLQNSLRTLESEAIYIFREAIAEFNKPMLLFSGGKDSIVMLHMALKAFHPDPVPFPIVHILTHLDFPEVVHFRDTLVSQFKLELLTFSVLDVYNDSGLSSQGLTRNQMQSATLLAAIRNNGFDAAFGGGRRDEDRARAKERLFSHRDESGHWNARDQRPEFWSLFNTELKNKEHMRVFPLSNWTERQVWEAINVNDIQIPSLYFAHERKVVLRDGMLFPYSEHFFLRPGEKVEERTVRFRTVGDMTLTACVESSAATVSQVITELMNTRYSERGATRADDRTSGTAMEDRKSVGYF